MQAGEKSAASLFAVNPRRRLFAASLFLRHHRSVVNPHQHLPSVAQRQLRRFVASQRRFAALNRSAAAAADVFVSAVVVSKSWRAISPRKLNVYCRVTLGLFFVDSFER